MPDTVQYTLNHPFLLTTLGGRCLYYHHSTGEETEATYSASHSCM